MRVQDVTQELNTAFGGHRDRPSPSAGAAVPGVAGGKGSVRVVVAGAVDEAADPVEMAQFLTRLSWYATVLA